MTRGARKRAALWVAFVPHVKEGLGFDPTAHGDVRAQKRHAAGCLRHSPKLTAAYLAERRRWGVARKLTPIEGYSRSRGHGDFDPLTRTRSTGWGRRTDTMRRH